MWAPEGGAGWCSTQVLLLCCPSCHCSLAWGSWAVLIWALSSWPAEPWDTQSLPLLLLCRAGGGEKTLPSSPTVPGCHKAVGLSKCLDLCWRTDLTGGGLLSLLHLLALREHQGCDLLLYLPPAVIISLLSVLQRGTSCTLWDSLHAFSYGINFVSNRFCLIRDGLQGYHYLTVANSCCFLRVVVNDFVHCPIKKEQTTNI